MAVITQRGSGGWQAKIRRRGRPPISKTFARKGDADAWARAVEREMDVGTFLDRSEAERLTFHEACERYEREILVTKRAQRQPRSMLARLCEVFGKHSLAGISSSMLAAYRDERLKIVSAQTVVHELGLVSRVFKAATMDWGVALPQGIPTSQIRKPRVANSRDRRLELGEEELLLEAFSGRPFVRAAFVLACETAARQSELISLQWEDVDLKKRVARLRGPGGGVMKSGDDYRDVPLSSKALAVIVELPRSVGKRSAFVLPFSQNALRLAWDRALASARRRHLHGRMVELLRAQGIDGEREVRALIYKKRPPLPQTVELLAKLDRSDKTLINLHWHDLRHEATSRLADKLAMHELMKVTGHKSSSMLARYYHPRAAELALKLG